MNLWIKSRSDKEVNDNLVALKWHELFATTEAAEEISVKEGWWLTMQSLALIGNLDLPSGQLTRGRSCRLTRQAALHYHGDLETAKTLILSHRGFVHIAHGMRACTTGVQESSIGHSKPCRFNPEVGAPGLLRRSGSSEVTDTFCVTGVSSSCDTKPQRKLFFNLRKTKRRLGWFNQDEVEIVANELGVTSKTYVRWNHVWRHRTC